MKPSRSPWQQFLNLNGAWIWELVGAALAGVWIYTGLFWPVLVVVPILGVAQWWADN